MQPGGIYPFPQEIAAWEAWWQLLSFGRRGADSHELPARHVRTYPPGAALTRWLAALGERRAAPSLLDLRQ